MVKTDGGSGGGWHGLWECGFLRPTIFWVLGSPYKSSSIGIPLDPHSTDSPKEHRNSKSPPCRNVRDKDGAPKNS